MIPRPVKSISAFTLIEVMVVVALIGILATLGINSYSRALINARDAKRKSDLDEVFKAATQYWFDHDGNVPDEGRSNPGEAGKWYKGKCTSDSKGGCVLSSAVSSDIVDHADVGLYSLGYLNQKPDTSMAGGEYFFYFRTALVALSRAESSSDTGSRRFSLCVLLEGDSGNFSPNNFGEIYPTLGNPIDDSCPTNPSKTCRFFCKIHGSK
ncbi:prepilin-type N-terminal cleavage/methylation domain-containing protein [bacterium]|nr:prepilin-type N-terminal cleavage/methylation domain-containing protein [bacterium]